METIYDANASLPPRPRVQAECRAPEYRTLPDLYDPPRRRRLHPMIVAGAMFGCAAALFYSAEATLPVSYKPSTFTGGYEKAIAKARTEGELAARIGYDSKLKVIETAAVQWQEQCRAGLQNFTSYYQAAYARANAYAQATADIQKQYAAARYQTAQGSVAGELGAANTATSIGYLLGFFDEDLGRQSMDFAERARQQALSKLDDAARTGMTVSVDGWNTGLPDPATLPPVIKCDVPTSLITGQPSLEG